jgi:hypothetical protein
MIGKGTRHSGIMASYMIVLAARRAFIRAHHGGVRRYMHEAEEYVNIYGRRTFSDSEMGHLRLLTGEETPRDAMLSATEADR